MITLGIETSCDETASAIVNDGHILSSVVSSSVPLHEKYGGVIPEIASRFHVEYINRVTKKALKKAGKKLSEVDLVAVTDSPGLPGSLLVGVSFAKALGYSLKVPVVPVNHLHAHLYANFLTEGGKFLEFPLVGVVVSGGHTNIFISRSFSDFEVIGRTKDDAIGEAFDKVAKILGIGYPGGPRIEKYAKHFSGKAPINFPRAYMDKDSFDFSLSGVKTSVLYYIKNRKSPKKEISRISWSFQEAVFDVLVDKIIRACKKYKIYDVIMGGGVIANMRLRAKLKHVSRRMGYRFFCPPPALCLDNAAMIAGLGEAIVNANPKIREVEK